MGLDELEVESTYQLTGAASPREAFALSREMQQFDSTTRPMQPKY